MPVSCVHIRVQRLVQWSWVLLQELASFLEISLLEPGDRLCLAHLCRCSDGSCHGRDSPPPEVRRRQRRCNDSPPP